MEFHFDKAFRIFLRTYPFVLARLLISLVVLAGTVMWWIGVYYLFVSWPFPGPPFLAWIFGGILFGSGVKLVRNYVLYLIKAAHVSVITRLAIEGELPLNTDQLSFGLQTVLRHFFRVSILFGVDQLVKVVLKAFNRTVFRLLRVIPGAGTLRGFSQRVLDYSLGYVDEAILSYTLLQAERNPWSAAREGLILYVQNWKTILGSGFVLALISYGLTTVLAAPGLVLAWAVPSLMGKVTAGIFAGVAVILKFAVMDPFALTSVIVNFHAAIEGQTPDPSWGTHLEEVSKDFRRFNSEAEKWGLGGTTPPPAPFQA
ncbi:MAG: hypothetical protein P8020_14145 [Acidobacteriota bacterium]|jgi:hypothetical protein